MAPGKIINNRRYILHYEFNSKRNAKSQAKDLKNSGYNYRIQKIKSNKKSYYQLWKRRK